MERLRVGVVGLNPRVERVVLPGLAASPRATVAAVCSRDPAKAERFAAAYPGCRPFAHMGDMLGSGLLDALFVLTPHEQHAEMSLAAIERGLAVCCEKPLGATLAEARAMARAAREAGARTAVNFTYRSSPGFRVVDDAARDPGIGALLHADIAYMQSRALLGDRDYRDPLLDLGPHPIDALLWWGEACAAGRPVQAAAMAATTRPPPPLRGGEPLSWCGLLTWSSGATSALRLSRTAAGRGNAVHAQLHGTIGGLTLEFDTDRQRVAHAPGSGDRLWRELPVPPTYDVDYASFPALHFDRLVRALLGEAEFPGFEQGLRVQLVLDALERAAREGRSVEVASPG